MPFKRIDILSYNMIPNPSDFIIFYDGLDKELNKEKWAFVELSIGGIPIKGSIIHIPLEDSINKDKYILEHLKKCNDGPYICKQKDVLGVWNHHKHKFYEFMDQEGSRDELIDCLLRNINNKRKIDN